MQGEIDGAVPGRQVHRLPQEGGPPQRGERDRYNEGPPTPQADPGLRRLRKWEDHDRHFGTVSDFLLSFFKSSYQILMSMLQVDVNSVKLVINSVVFFIISLLKVIYEVSKSIFCWLMYFIHFVFEAIINSQMPSN